MAKPDKEKPAKEHPDHPHGAPPGQDKKEPAPNQDLPVDPSTGQPHKSGEVPLGGNQPLP